MQSKRYIHRLAVNVFLSTLCLSTMRALPLWVGLYATQKCFDIIKTNESR